MHMHILLILRSACPRVREVHLVPSVTTLFLPRSSSAHGHPSYEQALFSFASSNLSGGYGAGLNWAQCVGIAVAHGELHLGVVALELRLQRCTCD